MGTKESVYIRKEINSHRIGLEHHGRRFIVLERQHGRRDVLFLEHQHGRRLIVLEHQHGRRDVM